MKADSFWEDAEVISEYSRAQAIEDGCLIDVSETAREAGIKFPVAMTADAWARYVEVPRDPYNDGCQSVRGRLWDVVWMLRHAIRTQADGSEIIVKFLCVVESPRYANGGKPESGYQAQWIEQTPSECRLKATCGPGDNMEPVITLMLPEED